MSPRYYIDYRYTTNRNAIEKRWCVIDGLGKRDEVLLRYTFDTAENALTFCEYLNRDSND